jgi:hypothetical protein
MATADSNLKQEDKFFNFKKELMANLEEHLTCSECKEVPKSATIFWCSAHHLVCQICYDIKKSKCFRNFCNTTGILYMDLIGKMCGTCQSCVAHLTPNQVKCGGFCKFECKPALSPFVALVSYVWAWGGGGSKCNPV